MRAIFVLLTLSLVACGVSPSQVATRIAETTQRLAPTADVGTRYTVTGQAPAVARIEPVTIGPIFATFQPGDSVTVVTTIIGQTVGGSDQWHVIEMEGRRLYIHSSRLQP